MHGMIAFTRIVGLLTCVLIIRSACGSSGAAAPTTTVSGPALLFFYTDK